MLILQDSTPPNIFSLIFPKNGVWTLSSPTFNWQSSNDALSGLLKYQLWIDGVVDQDSIPTSQTSCTSSVPLSEGFHTWNIKAVDKAGNERLSNQTWTVRVDGNSPTSFNLLNPADNVWTSNTQPTFTWQASSDVGFGLNKYQLFIDGALNRDNISPSETSTTPVSPLSSADHSWYVVAVDNVGNSQQSDQTRIIRIDNTPPTAFDLNAPSDNSWTGDTTPTFSWQASTDAGCGVLKYELWVDGVVSIDSISSNCTSVTLDESMALSNGNHTWFVKSYDKAYNVRQSNSIWTLRVDTVPPANFSLDSPPDSGFANFPTPNFSWNATTDASAGLSHYQLWIDGALNLDNITTTTSSPGTPLTEGPHSWFVKAVDKVNNERKSEQTWTIFGEWNPPEPFDLASPKNGDTIFVSQPFLSWYPSNDVGSGILKYQLWIDGILNLDNISPTDTSARPINKLPNGVHNWFVKAFDRALNTTSSSSTWQIVVNRDITPPISTITNPVQGQVIGGTGFTIIGAADDGIGSGVDIVHISVDGGATWHEATKTNENFTAWNYVWTGLKQGSHTIKSKATDKRGNQESPGAGITVNIDLTKPKVVNIIVTPSPSSYGEITLEIEFSASSSGLNYTAPPLVEIITAGNDTITANQTEYSNKRWRGTALIPATVVNGTANSRVSRAVDVLGNIMDPNPNAGAFIIDTKPPLPFDLYIALAKWLG